MQESYKMMDKVLVSFVKKIGIKTVLTQQKFTGLLRVYYYNWIGVDNKFYSLLAPCSYDKVYTQNIFSFSGLCSTLFGALKNNLRVFETKEEWDAGKWSRDDACEYNNRLQHEMEKTATMRVTVGKYRVEDVQLHIQPTLGITVWYCKGEDEFESITLWSGAKTTVFSLDREFVEFIDALGFSECVAVKGGMSDLLRIGEFNDFTEVDG